MAVGGSLIINKRMKVTPRARGEIASIIHIFCFVYYSNVSELELIGSLIYVISNLYFRISNYHSKI